MFLQHKRGIPDSTRPLSVLVSCMDRSIYSARATSGREICFSCMSQSHTFMPYCHCERICEYNARLVRGQRFTLLCFSGRSDEGNTKYNKMWQGQWTMTTLATSLALPLMSFRIRRSHCDSSLVPNSECEKEGKEEDWKKPMCVFIGLSVNFYDSLQSALTAHFFGSIHMPNFLSRFIQHRRRFRSSLGLSFGRTTTTTQMSNGA